MEAQNAHQGANITATKVRTIWHIRSPLESCSRFFLTTHAAAESPTQQERAAFVNRQLLTNVNHVSGGQVTDVRDEVDFVGVSYRAVDVAHRKRTQTTDPQRIRIGT